MSTNVERNNILKHVGLFLIIVLPVTWLLMGLALHFGDGNPQGSPISYILYLIGCYMPAIAAVLVCLLLKESIRELKFLPKLQGNCRVYFMAIIGAVIVSLIDPLIIILFYPKVGLLDPEVSVIIIVFTVLQCITIGCLQFFMLMGEEIGWMGFLFPRLEKICGTTLGIVITGVIRGLWHTVLFVQEGKFMWEDFGMLIFTNIVGGCMLVLLTQISGSVVPAAVFHSITNIIPSVMYTYIVMDAQAYEEHKTMITLVGYIPYVIIMAVCYIVIIKKCRRE